MRWYGQTARDLPWRYAPGQHPDPYRVWLSEVMLQQTTVATVRGYFARFVARYPNVDDLAAASLPDVLALWQGLGYYARARNLHACAQVVVRDWGGKLPKTKDDLMTLPGIGDYTAGAIAAIAFNQPVIAMDANIDRVLVRLYAVTTPLPQAKKHLRELFAPLIPTQRPGDFIQALMDLGSTVCTPRQPNCAVCPVQKFCRAFVTQQTDTLPRFLPKTKKPVRHGWVVVARNKAGHILLRQRRGKTMLGEMIELPSSDWDQKSAEKKITPALPTARGMVALPDMVEHHFSHFTLRLKIYRVTTVRKIFADGFWCDPTALGDHGIPTLFKKVLRAAGL